MRHLPLLFLETVRPILRFFNLYFPHYEFFPEAFNVHLFSFVKGANLVDEFN
jgi:hypothetical protein